jgi:hypothetical protein
LGVVWRARQDLRSVTWGQVNERGEETRTRKLVLIYDIIFRWKFKVRELGSHAVCKSRDQDRTPYRMSGLNM